MKRHVLYIIFSLLLIPFIAGCTLINTAPTVMMKNDFTLTYEVSSDEPEWLDAIETVSDDQDDLSKDNVVVDADEVDMDKVGTYTVYFEITDEDGKKTDEEIIIEIVDTTKPQITLNGEDKITILAGFSYDEEGVTIIDNYDTDLDDELVIDDSEVDYSQPGTYTITYNVEDSNGNVADEVQRTIVVKEDLSLLISDELESIIREYLQKQEGPITKEDCEDIDLLVANNRNLTSLRGIEYLINMTEFYAMNNQLEDLTPLKGLTNLKKLNLSNNDIDDVSALSHLTDLEVLILKSNEIIDATPIASLTNLQELNLGENKIKEVSSLKDLTNLSVLWLNDNRINDISMIVPLYRNGAFRDEDSELVIFRNPLDVTNGSPSYNAIFFYTDYGLNIQHTEMLTPEAYEETYEDAQLIELNKKIQGYIGYPNDIDWYKIVIMNNEEIEIEYDDNDLLTVEFFLYDNNELTSLVYDKTRIAKDVLVQHKTVETGIYYVKVSVNALAINGGYNLEIREKIEY